MTRLTTVAHPFGENRYPVPGVRTCSIWRWVLLAGLAAGLVILAHGCHGPDEDHELFIRQILRL
jgi:hypothetical protein